MLGLAAPPIAAILSLADPPTTSLVVRRLTVAIRALSAETAETCVSYTAAMLRNGI